jgi:hypothetical protein
VAYDVPSVVKLNDDPDTSSEEVVGFGWRALRGAFIPSYRATQELHGTDSGRDQTVELLEYRPRSAPARIESADSICVYEDTYR